MTDALREAAREVLACFDTRDPEHEAWWEAAAGDMSWRYEREHCNSDTYRQGALSRLRAALDKPCPICGSRDGRDCADKHPFI